MNKILYSKNPAKQICLLNNLKCGESARILSLEQGNKLLARRMYEMGLTKGTVIKIKKIAPFGDPVSIELRGYELCLRRRELKNIEVEIL